MGFKLIGEKSGQAVIIAVAGDLTTCETAKSVIALFNKHFGQGARMFVLDLTSTRRLNDEGAQALKVMRKECLGCGQIRLVLTDQNAQVWRKLEQLGFDKLFDIFESLEAARESFEPAKVPA